MDFDIVSRQVSLYGQRNNAKLTITRHLMGFSRSNELDGLMPNAVSLLVEVN